MKRPKTFRFGARQNLGAVGSFAKGDAASVAGALFKGVGTSMKVLHSLGKDLANPRSVGTVQSEAKQAMMYGGAVLMGVKIAPVNPWVGALLISGGSLGAGLKFGKQVLVYEAMERIQRIEREIDDLQPDLDQGNMGALRMREEKVERIKVERESVFRERETYDRNRWYRDWE